MERCIRPIKRCRNLAMRCLIFFVSVGLASACGIGFSALPERRFQATLFMAVFWGFWSALSCWLLLAYWQEELRIADGQLTQRGVIRLKEIDLRSLTSIRWGIAPQSSGGLVLRTPTEKVTILLGNFDPADRLWLIRYFRNGVSAGLQEGWALFCHKIAVPLRDTSASPSASSRPGTVRITQSRWDRYFVPSIVLFMILGVVFCWWLKQSQMLVLPAAPVVLWLCVRYTTPREGLVTERITSRPELVVWHTQCQHFRQVLGVLPHQRSLDLTFLSLTTTLLATILYLLPDVRPLLSPRKWSSTDWAGLFRQVRLIVGHQVYLPINNASTECFHRIASLFNPSKKETE